MGLIPFYYFVVLVFVKKFYKRINERLISKKYVDIKYLGKDFTYIFMDGDLPEKGVYWDEKLASKPSWLDHFFTHAIYIIPLIICLGIDFIGEAQLK